MRVLWIEISDLWPSAATLLTKSYTIQKFWGLSNEILWILVAKGDAKLYKVKVEGLKSDLCMQGDTFYHMKIVAFAVSFILICVVLIQ